MIDLDNQGRTYILYDRAYRWMCYRLDLGAEKFMNKATQHLVGELLKM